MVLKLFKALFIYADLIKKLPNSLNFKTTALIISRLFRMTLNEV